MTSNLNVIQGIIGISCRQGCCV